MGKRKVSKTKSLKGKSKKIENKKEEKGLSSNIQGAILVILGIVLFVFLEFKNVGIVSEFIKNISFGIFGKISLLLSITFIFVGIHEIVSKEKTKVSKELNKGVILTCLLCATIYSFTLND